MINPGNQVLKIHFKTAVHLVGLSGTISQLLLPTLAVKLPLCFNKKYVAESLFKPILFKVSVLLKQGSFPMCQE